ncbi:hypothetical protein B0H13DRAFT_1850340 [Mycena leptocephala]|nr:hypothetical protein B0H13DRAFT_1850340 [Mycena leptocephala]
MRGRPEEFNSSKEPTEGPPGPITCGGQSISGIQCFTADPDSRRGPTLPIGLSAYYRRPTPSSFSRLHLLPLPHPAVTEPLRPTRLARSAAIYKSLPAVFFVGVVPVGAGVVGVVANDDERPFAMAPA